MLQVWSVATKPKWSNDRSHIYAVHAVVLTFPRKRCQAIFSLKYRWWLGMLHTVQSLPNGVQLIHLKQGLYSMLIRPDARSFRVPAAPLKVESDIASRISSPLMVQQHRWSTLRDYLKKTRGFRNASFWLVNSQQILATIFEKMWLESTFIQSLNRVRDDQLK